MSAWSRIRWHNAALPAMVVICFALSASAADEDFSSLTKCLQAEKPNCAAPTVVNCKEKIMSSIWRSILLFIAIVLVLGVLGTVFFAAH